MCVAQVAPFREGLHPWLTLDTLTLGGGTLLMQSSLWRQDCTLPNRVITTSCIDL